MENSAPLTATFFGVYLTFTVVASTQILFLLLGSCVTTTWLKPPGAPVGKKCLDGETDKKYGAGTTLVVKTQGSQYRSLVGELDPMFQK